MDKSYVSPFLFNIKRAEVNGPILQFQSTIFEKEDVKKLLSSLNTACSDDQLTQERLDKTFDVWYPTLEQQLNDLLSTSEKIKDEAPTQEQSDTANQILEEILDLSRDNQKLLRSSDDEPSKEIESIRMMLKKLINNMEFDIHSPRSKRRRKMHPMMIEELIHMSPRFEKSLTGFQIALSLFRNDFPWVYDAGIDLSRTVKSQIDPTEKRDAVEAFFELLEVTFEHPMMREMHNGDKDMIIMGRELRHILKRSLDRYM